jgi:hypothetical protein
VLLLLDEQREPEFDIPFKGASALPVEKIHIN